jgi:predicted ATP-grasp superfamily ATP-dependent carboligase
VRIGAFDLTEPVPELVEPHAFVVIQQWIDVGGAGKLTLSGLETALGGQELATLRRPGNFLDLTRYRPTIHRHEDHVEVDIPSAVVSYGRQEGGRDFLFLRLPEPHMLAETYIDSVMALLAHFSVKRYCLLGSMYDVVPYTRPLLVTGAGGNRALQNELDAAKVVSSEYEGPTTILYLLGQKAAELGMETMSLVVHLPNYLNFEDDYRGVARLMEVLHSLYGFTMTDEDTAKANEQAEQFAQIAEQIMQQEPRYRQALSQLEANYDARIGEKKEETRLSPEVEKFLQDLDSKFGQ